jgi:hypothetical protein
MTSVSRLGTHFTRRPGSHSLARPRVNASVRRMTACLIKEVAHDPYTRSDAHPPHGSGP